MPASGLISTVYSLLETGLYCIQWHVATLLALAIVKALRTRDGISSFMELLGDCVLDIANGGVYHG